MAFRHALQEGRDLSNKSIISTDSTVRIAVRTRAMSCFKAWGAPFFRGVPYRESVPWRIVRKPLPACQLSGR